MNVGKGRERILVYLALMLPLIGPVLATVIEERILGLPVETREPVVGAYTWIIAGGLGIILGVWHSRFAKRRRWLGLVAVALNLISLSGRAVIYPSTLIVNTTAVPAKVERQIEWGRQQTPARDSVKPADGLHGTREE